jgi:hypothetical protein
MSPADDKATFLAEFRALRDRAAIDYDELAARTHFPTDLLKEAEGGPGLPGLPVLAAYVRACGGEVTEWEERWRALGAADCDDTGLPTRLAGASPAARAGARAGVSVTPAEMHDAERIKAALRAHREREELASNGVNGGTPGGHYGGPRAGTMLAGDAGTTGTGDGGSGHANGSGNGFRTVVTEAHSAKAAPSLTPSALTPSAFSGPAAGTGNGPAQVPGQPASGHQGSAEPGTTWLGPSVSGTARDPGQARQLRVLGLAVVLVIIGCVLALMLT